MARLVAHCLSAADEFAMRCPACKEINKDKVIDSRLTEGGSAIRRRRECLACGRRFTTKERLDEDVRLSVIKKDNTREPFDRNKILVGLHNSCYKRSISADTLQQFTTEVEEEILHQYDREVESRRIGELIGPKLRALDKVAYIRFMSVYHDFADVGDFIEEAKGVQQHAATETPGQQSLFEQDDQ